jgi:hypothetical protein
MLTRLIALLVFSSALAVLGQDALKPASYTFGLEHEAIHGRIIGNTVNVLILGKQQIRYVSHLSMR